jgi:hypothetical protein
VATAYALINCDGNVFGRGVLPETCCMIVSSYIIEFEGIPLNSANLDISQKRSTSEVLKQDQLLPLCALLTRLVLLLVSSYTITLLDMAMMVHIPLF